MLYRGVNRGERARLTTRLDALARRRSPRRRRGRFGIPISADEEQARQAVADLIDQIGFDPVDAGTIAEGGRKHQPGGAAYTQGLHTAELRARLAD